MRDSSSYYLLGYYPTDERRNGSVRRIQVKVNRKDVNVFARKAYQAPKDKDEKKLTESAAGHVAPRSGPRSTRRCRRPA